MEGQSEFVCIYPWKETTIGQFEQVYKKDKTKEKNKKESKIENNTMVMIKMMEALMMTMKSDNNGLYQAVNGRYR